MRRVATALLVVLAVGLVATAAYAQSQPPSLKEQRAATKALVAATNRYLQVTPPAIPGEPASWVDFFDRGDALLADTRAAFDRWASVIRRALKAPAVRPADKRLLRRYRSAEDAWVTAQEEQARLSRACFAESRTIVDGQTCVQTLRAEHGASWNGIANELNRLQHRVDARL